MNSHFSRRDVLRLGTGAAATTLAGTLALGAEKSGLPRVGVIGVGSRGTYHVRLLLTAGVEIPALCDIDESHLGRAIDLVAGAREGRKPDGYSKGPYDYRRMLQRDDLDAVVIATPMQVHAEMAIDALKAGKHALSEVAAAMTMDQCWGLVRAAAETGNKYMLAENCCYWEHLMAVGNMIGQGLFGELTFAECGYVHDCRALDFNADGTLTWRGELARDHRGNLYPTHSFGPVAKWLGINRGDRMASLVAMDTRQAAAEYYVKGRFPEGNTARGIEFKVGDSTTVLIRTAKGVMIDLRYDTKSARPHPSTCYHALQGTKASYESRLESIWIEGRSKGRTWEPFADYAAEFEHPMWKRFREQAQGTGHGGADFFVVREFLDCIQGDTPPPIDAADAAAWSAIIPLSAKSLAEGSAPQPIPDFTEGRWETRRS